MWQSLAVHQTHFLFLLGPQVDNIVQLPIHLNVAV